MEQDNLILGIGELLWDVLPEGPRLGGAPANFSVMAARLGNPAAILSRTGRDALGREAIEQLSALPVDAGSVQIDAAHETGRVTVTLESGQPSYTIHEPAAWDFMELTDDWIKLARLASAICFGSLAQRSAASRQTIQSLVAETHESCVRVFDVNLRAPYYSAEIVQQSLELASVLKMNDGEVPAVLKLLDIERGLDAFDGPAELHTAAQRLLSEFSALRMVAITRGGHGSLLVTRGEVHEHGGFPIVVADTVGAGDAFTAAMTHYLLRGASLARVSEAGNRWGAWVASQSGGMPELSGQLRASLAAEIERVG